MREFLSILFSNKDEVSSKRILGTFGLCVYVGILIGTFLGLGLSENQVTLLTNLLYTSSALLGLGVLDRKLKT